MRWHRFEMVEPKGLRPGDLIYCMRHDDQHEWRTARIEAMDLLPAGVQVWSNPELAPWPYDYRVKLTCRHVNFRRLDAIGGPSFEWWLFPWNERGRIITPETVKAEAEAEAKDPK